MPANVCVSDSISDSFLIVFDVGLCASRDASRNNNLFICFLSLCFLTVLDKKKKKKDEV